MHIYRQIHVYAHIYLPEGGNSGDETAQMLLTNINRVQRRFWALQAQEEFAAAAL